MKRKVGTILDGELVHRAKQVALAHEQSLSRLLEEALKMYLGSVEKKRGRQKNISQSTQGSMRVSPKILKAVMEEEDLYEIG